MKKKFYKLFVSAIVFVIAAMSLIVNIQHKKNNALFNMNTIFTTASADCEWNDGYTTACDYVVQYYCRIDGPYGSIVVLDCRPN